MPEIPKEHQLECPTCGRIVDMRDLGQVLSHGYWNDHLKQYQCDDEPMDIPYSTSRKIGEPIEWTKDKKPINLN